MAQRVNIDRSNVNVQVDNFVLPTYLAPFFSGGIDFIIGNAIRSMFFGGICAMYINILQANCMIRLNLFISG